MRAQSPDNWLQTTRVYLAVSAALHLGWEMLQLPLYTIWRTGTPGEIAFAVIHCTAGDLMIASLTLLIALLAFGHRAWPAEASGSVITATIGLGAGYTVYSEWLNTTVRKSWAYTEMMPIVPGLGTGLSPLLQWLIVPAIAFAVAVRAKSRTA